MNVTTKDVCPACGRKGLLRADLGKLGRRKCSLCFKEEARPYDRALYLACVCEIEWDHDDRRRQHRLGGWWSVEPFFNPAEAEAFLLGRMKPGENYLPIIVGGHDGHYCSSHGTAWFYFVDRKLVDIRPLEERSDS